MDDELTLHLLLRPPEATDPAGTLVRFEAVCWEMGSDAGEGRIPEELEGDGGAPLSWPAAAVELAWYLEEYWKWPYGGFAERARAIEAMMARLGRLLFRQLLTEAGDVIYRWCYESHSRLKVAVQGRSPTGMSLPWELLHDGQGFLVLRSRPPVSVVRQLPGVKNSPLDREFDPPLRVLLVTARPEGAGFVNQRVIARELLDAVEARRPEGGVSVVVELLRPPTIAALRERLEDSDRPVHVLHFDGHGVFDPGTGRGFLAFEDDAGGLDRVEAAVLAQSLQGSGVRLAILTACQSATGRPDDPGSGVAGALLKGGVPAVVAMSASVLVATAARYAEAFYRGWPGASRRRPPTSGGGRPSTTTAAATPTTAMTTDQRRRSR